MTDTPSITTPTPPPEKPSAPGPLFRFDPGWLFLIAGVAVIAAAVLIPAADSLRDARYRRDAVLNEERFRAKRLENYSSFLDAAERNEPAVTLALATTQINEAPEHLTPIITQTDGRELPASVFPELEPEYKPLPEPAPPDSRLQRWATDPRIRPWLIVAGAVCILAGILPTARPSTRP